jgi:hypothetical protein
MLFAMVLLACALTGPAAEPAVHPADIAAEVDRLAAQPLWPGFDPRQTPIAIYDGERTWLFRHPSLPEGFVRDPDHEDATVYPGQHPEVRSNTSANIGGVSTATFIMNPAAKRSLTESAGIVIHETFHVFQRQHHPDWTANEGELFTYPVEDAEGLHLRRLETEALRMRCKRKRRSCAKSSCPSPAGGSSWSSKAASRCGRRASTRSTWKTLGRVKCCTLASSNWATRPPRSRF